MNDEPFWSRGTDRVLSDLGVTTAGLSTAEAATRRARSAADALETTRRRGTSELLLRQFASPIILILIAAAILSIFLGEHTDAEIIMGIVLFSGLLGFWQERGASSAMARLAALVRSTATVLRDGSPASIPTDEVVPGDILRLSAGNLIPADTLLLESNDLFVDEAALTGETFPVEKHPGSPPADAPPAGRYNALFMGTHVVSGTGAAVVVATGRRTELGRISQTLRKRPPETDFERGIRQFGYLLVEVTLLLVLAIFAFNVYLARPVIDSFLFATALAVGLTPQLLPAIISINLAHGARSMARRKVIVKRLSAIENLGSMTTLCSDKTGTLTEGSVRIRGTLDVDGDPSPEVERWALANASFESGFVNPIDQAIRSGISRDLSDLRKDGEIPYDFTRKRLGIAVTGADGTRTLVVKGAVKNVLEICATARRSDGSEVPIAEARAALDHLFESASNDGLRVLAVAVRGLETAEKIDSACEREMTLLGFLTFFDPPKPGIERTVARLGELGVRLAIITGDNRLVAERVGRQTGMPDPVVLTGPELQRMSEPALHGRVARVDIFAEVEPSQKERIIRALRAAGEVVGYMGDGINDASALHAADVGISVDGAVDVAKEAAEIVLLEHELDVLIDGVLEGRRTFTNTLKYIFMATSANFGNMFSMAGASLVLPFLPLLPKQILLTNLLTDIPETMIARDNVEPEMIARPRRWDLRFIRAFMVVFGLISSMFDVITFTVLLTALHAGQDELRSGWFVESVVSASLIVLVIRSRASVLRSRPGRALLVATICIAATAVALPYSPLAGLFGLVPLPARFLAVLAGIVLAYAAVTELAKRIFYRRFHL